MDREYIEAEEKVFAEPSRSYLLAQIDVGGGDDPHVDTPGMAVAQPLEFTLLQHAQQLSLRHGAERCDLVEEERPAVGAFEAAGPALHRAGVRASLDAEELRLDQLLGDRRTIERCERPFMAGTEPMQRAREDLFTHTAFAEEEHGGLRGGDAFDLGQDGIEARRNPDQ